LEEDFTTESAESTKEEGDGTTNDTKPTKLGMGSIEGWGFNDYPEGFIF